MNIIFENGINEFNGHELAAWSNEKGIDFQEQWMGPTIEYPLNYSKLKSLENLYSTMQVALFTIKLIKF